jgi:nucleoside-diphosphate-sugar epimerase
MRLLLIGGSGLVGCLIIPYLNQDHQIVVYDLNRPAGELGVEYRAGSVEDVDGLRAAMDGIDAVVYLAMNPKQDWGSVPTSALAFDINVKGLYLAWWAAAEAGVEHGVHASTMSVYRTRPEGYPDETVPPDAQEFYGFTKALGEQVCRHATEHRGLSINSLRLCHPTADDRWPVPGDSLDAIISTRAGDVAAAVEAALHHRDGHQVFTVSGDLDQRKTNWGKAERELGWRPTAP